MWGFAVRGSWRPNINCNILTPLLWPSLLCLSCSLGLLNRRPRAHSAGCWLSLLHLISIFSGPQTPPGFQRVPSVGCGFPYHISFPTVWNSTGNSTQTRTPTLWLAELNWNRNSTQLYNHLAPTRSLKLNVYSSSSRNNCYAVQRSLSSGASLYSGTVGPSPCPILLALIRPHDLFWLLAIGMCHFLPVHHLGIAFLGQVEGQNITPREGDKERETRRGW